MKRVGSRLPKHSAPVASSLRGSGISATLLRLPLPGKQQVMVGADVGAEPRLVQGRELRRQADQRIDEEDLLELLRPVAAGDQQMADLVLRIEQAPR